MNPDFGEARFALACVVIAAAITALFTHFLTGSEFVTITGAALTLYSAHSAIDDKVRDWRGMPPVNNGHE